MTSRVYGQYCGLARALEVVGERWAMLIVRDLLVGPRRYTDLRRALPRIPTNILSTRLRELEQAGIVVRRALPRPSGAMRYELTAYGRDLDEVVLALGRWGARGLGEPRPDETVSVESLVMALRATFRPAAARGLRVGYEIRVGEVVLHAQVDGERLDTGPGPLPGADLVIVAGPAVRAMMTGELDPATAIDTGAVRISGDPGLLTRFAELFRIDPAPAGAGADPVAGSEPAPV